MRYFRLFLVLVFVGLSSLMMIPRSVSAAGQACSVVTLEQPHSDACNAEIAANPVPQFERPVAHDEATQGASTPRSVLLPKEKLPYPFGWVLKAVYYSATPGILLQSELTKARIIPKASMVYIYQTVKVRNVEWHLVGPDQWVSSEHIAVLKYPTRPEGVSGRWITLDLSEQTLLASIDDTPIFATLISAGYNEYGFTREGLFNIYARTRTTTFRGPPGANPPKYILNHVPDVMFFDEHIALHGAYWHDWFGYARSHGCVNIPVGDEAWLWNWVSEVADQWGPDEGHFFMPKPENAPFVYVYQSAKVEAAGK